MWHITARIEELLNNITLWVEHRWEALKHHLWDAHILEVFKHIKHQIKAIRSISFPCDVQSGLSIWVWVQYHKRCVNINFLYVFIVPDFDVLLMKKLNNLPLFSKVVEKRVSLEYLIELTELGALWYDKRIFIEIYH